MPGLETRFPFTIFNFPFFSAKAATMQFRGEKDNFIELFSMISRPFWLDWILDMRLIETQFLGLQVLKVFTKQKWNK